MSEKGGLNKISTNNENQLEKLIYFSDFGKKNYKLYNEILIVDSTMKTNRFNMALINFIGINCNGENVPFGFGSLARETEDNYTWLFQQLKILLEISPQVILTDECPSILSGFIFFFYK